MAIIKDKEYIIPHIPEPDRRLYGSNVTETPVNTAINNPLFAFIVNSRTKKVVSGYRAYFTLVNREEKYYLMVSNFDDTDTPSYTEYVTVKKSKTKELNKSDWSFITDEIGLRLDSEGYDKDIIYFATSAFDIQTVRDLLKKEEEKNVVTVEAVII